MVANILAIDPGATNTKGVLRRYSRTGDIRPDVVSSYSAPSATAIQDGIRCETAPEAMFKILAELPEKERQRLRAIVIASHGATEIPIDNSGNPVFGVVSYDNGCFDEHQGEFFQRFGSPEDQYLMTGTASFPKGINAAQQLYFWEKERRAWFETAAHLLPLSSYMAFLLTGNRFTSHTHTRNHAYLENTDGSWSRPVVAMGWQRLFPGFRRSFEPYGTVSRAVAAGYQLPADCMVVAAGHDTSVASLLAPNYINTGTWICNTCVGADRELTAEMAGIGLVVNADVYDKNLMTIMARLGQTRDAYRAMYGNNLPEDIAFKGLNFLEPEIVPLAFMEGVGVYPSLPAAEIPLSLRGSGEKLIHSLSFSIAIAEALSSIMTSDPDVPLGKTLGDLLTEGYSAKDVVIGGNFVRDLDDGRMGTFTEFFRRLYPGKVERFTFAEPTSFAAHICAVAALEGTTPAELSGRIVAPTEDISYGNHDIDLAQRVRAWEADLEDVVEG